MQVRLTIGLVLIVWIYSAWPPPAITQSTSLYNSVPMGSS